MRWLKHPKTFIVGFVLGGMLASGACLVLPAYFVVTWLPANQPLRNHFGVEPPANVKIIHRHMKRSGYDLTFAFAFSVNDDLFAKRLVGLWDMERAGEGKAVASFIHLDGAPSWWPGLQTLSRCDTYIALDENQETYANLWYDPYAGMLYIEHGNW